MFKIFFCFFFFCFLNYNNVNADSYIFLKLNKVPQHGSNITQLCVSTLKIEAPTANVTNICGDLNNYQYILSDYSLRGIYFKGVEGRGERKVPDELNQELNSTGFFIEKDGTVIAVVSNRKTEMVILYILLFYLIFTFLAIGVYILFT